MAFEYAFLISTLQAPVFRIDKEEDRVEPMTPGNIRRKKGSFTNELLNDLEKGSDAGLGIESDHRQPFISMHKAPTISLLSPRGTGGLLSANSSALGVDSAGGSSIGSNTPSGLNPNKMRTRFDELKGESSANSHNRRRSTTLLEFSEKGTKQNGKPAPPVSGPRSHSKLTEWIANFF